MGRKSQVKGKNSEQVTEMQLRLLGLNMIRKIPNHWRLVRRLPHVGNSVYVVKAGNKVAGDYRAVAPDGRSVLVEVKARNGRLQWSALANHQVANLDEHDATNGISLLAWVNESGCWVMRWPVAGFGPRQSIDEQTAAVLMEELIQEFCQIPFQNGTHV